MEKIHFHSFDAFRFFAFFKVYIFHATAVVVCAEGSALQWVKDHLTHGGGIGVGFFFVLSGFLITYILTHEKLKHGNVKLKKFFVRRAFRIWPLFYAMVIMAFLIPPDFAKQIGFHMNGGGYEIDPWYSFTFLENYKVLIMDSVPKTTPLSVFWSLCVEEQFYIVWMIVFFIIPRKYIPHYLLFGWVLAIFWRMFHADMFGPKNHEYMDLFSNMDYFVISGLMGYYVAMNYEKVAALSRKIPTWGKWVYVGCLLLVLGNQKFIFNVNAEWWQWLNYYQTADMAGFLYIFKYTIYSLMFASLLFMFIPKDNGIQFKESNILTKLGKISYGLYVYHIIWVHVIYQFFRDNDIVIDDWRSYSIYMFTTFTGTVITSWLSWKYFEKPLLNYREKIFPSNS